MSKSTKTHKDVEFHVELAGRDNTVKVFKTFDKAASHALMLALTHGIPVYVDAVVWSAAGARWYGGSDAVDQYNEDPEASVFDRMVVRVDMQGRVP